MKISTTSIKPHYKLNTFSTYTSVEVDDDAEILKEYKEIMERFNTLQCKLSKLFFNELDN